MVERRRLISPTEWATRLGAILTLLTAATTQSSAQHAPADRALDSRIDALIKQEASAGRFSGIVLVARGDRIVVQRSYGFADWERLVPSSPTTRFNVGSITKVMTETIVNLLVNGVQAIHQKGGTRGTIDLSTDSDERGAITFAMRDDGPGIAEGDINRVFDSFFTTKEEGMGIGLAICQSIISAHGGAIGASNWPHGGAHFWFTLPAAAG